MQWTKFHISLSCVTEPFNEKMRSGLPRERCKTTFLENGEPKLDCTFKLGLGLAVMHVRPQAVVLSFLRATCSKP